MITLRGGGLAVAAAALLGVGFWRGYPELAVLGATGVIALVAAVVHAVLRPRLAVRRAVDPDRVARDEGSTVILTIRNTGRFGAATLVALDRVGRAAASPPGAPIAGAVPAGTARRGRPRSSVDESGDARNVPVPLLRLRPGRDTDVSYPVPTSRRGVVQVGPLQVIRRDPLGLISVTRSHGDISQIWVYPRTHLIQAVPAGISRSLDGRLDRVPHGSITFDALREYVIGDELRHVHWRTSAKVGELMVREHVDTSLPRIVVLLDDRRASWPDLDNGDFRNSEAFESACEAAASVITAAVREDLPITLHLVSGAGAGGNRVRGSARGLLDLLAEAEPGHGTGALPGAQPGSGVNDLLTSATNRLRQYRPGDTLIYLTGAGGFTDLGLVTGLRGPFPSVAVGVLGPRAADEPESLEVLLLRAQDGAEFAAAWDGVSRW